MGIYNKIMKKHEKKFSSESTATEEPLLIIKANEQRLYTNEEIFERKWKILTVNCILFLVLTMVVDAPQQMQFILETKHNISTLKFLFFFVLVNFFSCFTRRIVNNFRKLYSNRTSLLTAFFLLMIGQALFVLGLYLKSYLIMIFGGLLLALCKDPLAILIISQVSKIFKHHYGNIPLSVLNSTQIIGNIINCLWVPGLLNNNPLHYASLLYLYMIIIASLCVAMIYYIEYNLEINAINEAFVRNELSRKRNPSSFVSRKLSDFSVDSHHLEYKFFDMKGFIQEFKSLNKEFYYISISGALSFLQLFTYTFMLNDFYTVNYQFSIEFSGNIIAVYFTLCLVLMPCFIYLAKLLKYKLNFLIGANLCAILLSFFSLLKIKFYYLNIVLHSVEYAILTGIITECFPYIVDQEFYYYAFEINRILLYFGVASGALVCGLVVTIIKSFKFIFPFYLYMIMNMVSIKLLFKVKENCASL